MRIIDNVTDLLGDDLQDEITPGSKVRIAASAFSIFAFEALKQQLEQVEELQFIFTSPSFVAEAVTDKLTKESRRFFIPTGEAESSLAGSDFEVRLRNKLTQKFLKRSPSLPVLQIRRHPPRLTHPRLARSTDIQVLMPLHRLPHQPQFLTETQSRVKKESLRRSKRRLSSEYDHARSRSTTRFSP